MRGRSSWWAHDQAEPAPEPVAQATGLPVAAPAPAGGTDDLRAAVVRMLTAQARMLDGWAEAGVIRRKDLWNDLHETADAVRDALDQPDDPRASEVREFQVVMSDVMKPGFEAWLAARGLYLFPIPVPDDLPTFGIGIKDLTRGEQ